MPSPTEDQTSEEDLTILHPWFLQNRYFYTFSQAQWSGLLTIFYKAFSKYRPGLDESNAESAERSKLIDEEITRLQALQKQLKTISRNKHSNIHDF